MTDPKPRRFTATEIEVRARDWESTNNYHWILKQAASDLRERERLRAVADELAGALEQTLGAAKLMMNVWVRGGTPDDLTHEYDGFGVKARAALSRYMEVKNG